MGADADFLGLILASLPVSATEGCKKSVIVINGAGEIEAKPDYVNINATLNSRNKDIKLARKEIDGIYAKLIKTITEKFDVAKTDIKANSVYINPVYKSCYDEHGNYKQCDQTKIDFYDISRSLTIKLSKLENYDAVLAAFAESGFASVSSGQFGIENVNDLKDQVRNLAIASAKAKAQKIAKALDVTLKKPVRFEAYDDAVNYPPVFANAKAAMVAEAAPSPTIVTDVDALGTIKLNANVTITYEIE